MFKKFVIVGGASHAVLGLGTAAFASTPAATGSPTAALAAPAAHKLHAHGPRRNQSHPRAVGDAERNEIHHPRRDPRRGDRRFVHLHQREGRRWGH